MFWANFLHIYQPAEQQPDILEAIVVGSYRPILEGIKKHRRVKLTLNINGVLLELFDKYKYHDLIDILRKLGREGRIEFTGSAKYHAFLPFLEEKEIIRQIKINDETNKFFLGKSYRPQGFFPPEMAYDEKLTKIIEDLGFKWIILDEIAFGGEVGKIDYTKIYQIKGTSLNVFFRERKLSNLIMSAIVRSQKTLLEAIKDDLKVNRYLITAMDGETFGHHRPGLNKLLFDIFETSKFNLIKISEIPNYYPKIETVEPIKSTWASSPQDIKKNIQFLSWSDPENIIHQWQWQFLNLVLEEFSQVPKNHPQYSSLRKRIDTCLASDQFWWASAKPWWSLEMIEVGAYRLLETIRQIPNVSKENLKKARDLYESIISTAFKWQRSGKIRKIMKEQKEILRIPFKERTFERGGAERGVYFAFLDMIKKLEKKAAREGEYEKAILWRDAIYKLEKKLDIYDTVNAIDLLRTEIPYKKVEETIEKYKQKYQRIRGGQPEQRGS